MKCAIYARVSTKDKGQDTENQLLQLREYCACQQREIAAEYIDRETAKHGDRDAFKQVFDGASKRLFDVVLVWALDRFTREGVLEAFEYIRDLTRFGVQLESYTEAHFRTTDPAGELMRLDAACGMTLETTLYGWAPKGDGKNDPAKYVADIISGFRKRGYMVLPTAPLVDVRKIRCD